MHEEYRHRKTYPPESDRTSENFWYNFYWSPFKFEPISGELGEMNSKCSGVYTFISILKKKIELFYLRTLKATMMVPMTPPVLARTFPAF